MNPILKELEHEISRIVQDNEEAVIKEKDGQLYFRLLAHDPAALTVRLYCRNDMDKEVSIEVYGFQNKKFDKKLILQKINEKNDQACLFKYCLNKYGNIFLRRDEYYKNPFEVLHLISEAFDMLISATPYFHMSEEKEDEGDGQYGFFTKFIHKVFS